MTVTQWRIQALQFLQEQGVPCHCARPAEAAAYQAYVGDRDVYNLMIEEIVFAYVEREDDAWTHSDLVAAAKAPLPAPVEEVVAVVPGAGRSKYVCPDCKTRDFRNIPFEQQERGADEGATQYRQCLNPECKHVWEIKTR